MLLFFMLFCKLSSKVFLPKTIGYNERNSHVTTVTIVIFFRRKKWKKCVIGKDFILYENQWKFLSQLKKLKELDIHEIIKGSQKADQTLGFNLQEKTSNDDKEPWNLFSLSKEIRK